MIYTKTGTLVDLQPTATARPTEEKICRHLRRYTLLLLQRYGPRPIPDGIRLWSIVSKTRMIRTLDGHVESPTTRILPRDRIRYRRRHRVAFRWHTRLEPDRLLRHFFAPTTVHAAYDPILGSVDDECVHAVDLA